MNHLVILPLLIPLVSAAASLVAWRSVRVQRWLGVTGTAAMLGAALALFASVRSEGIQVIQMGNWPAPFGITLVADLFSAVLVVIAAVMGLITAVYSLSGVDGGRKAFGYYPLLQILLMGVSGIFLTGDAFNLYVWLEVMLISSFVLISLGGETAQLKGAIKYLLLNLVSSSVLLAALGILYGVAGTLNMADLARVLGRMESPGTVTIVGMLFLVAFSIKAATFPLFFWLPDSYHTPPAAVTAIFSALLTKAGLYALIRLFTLLFVRDAGYTHTLILVIAGFTMVTGVLGAVAQNHMRRLLSFHIVSQIGYPLMGLGLLSPLGLAAAIYFVVHVILAKATLFFVSGIVHHAGGTEDLKKLGGLYRTRPLLAALFLLPAFSLAGIPPSSGFFAKLALVQAGLQTSQYAIVAVSLLVSLLTLYSMTKIWAEAFWKPSPFVQRSVDSVQSGARPSCLPAGLVFPTAVAAGLTVLLGLAAGPLMSLSLEAAGQLLDSSQYITAVLGEIP